MEQVILVESYISSCFRVIDLVESLPCLPWICKIMIVIELHLKTFEVLFVRIFYIVTDFIFIRNLYLCKDFLV